MRCLVLVPSLIRAGAETQAVDLANGLCERGNDVHLAIFERGLDQIDRVQSNVRFHELRRRSRADWSLVRALAGVIDDNRVEVVLGVMQYSALTAYLAARISRCRPPVVAGIHTTANVGIKEELQDRLIYRSMLGRLPAVIFVCESQRKFWLQRFPELRTNCHVIHNGVDTARFMRADFRSPAQRLRMELDIPAEAALIACIAAFRREKGHLSLVQAFARLPASAYLACAGDGVMRRQVEEQVRVLGVEGRVRFLGNIADVRPLIAASNATVLASTAVETFSMAMLESMALGVPMIAPRLGGMAEAIIPGRTGYLFSVGDLADLERCMHEVVSDPGNAATLGGAAAEMVAERFTRSQMVTRTESLLDEVLSRQS